MIEDVIFSDLFTTSGSTKLAVIFGAGLDEESSVKDCSNLTSHGWGGVRNFGKKRDGRSQSVMEGGQDFECDVIFEQTLLQNA